MILGNLIGTTANGETALANLTFGIESTGTGTTIGGTTAGATNVISGNGDANVFIAGNGAADDLVVGNYVGLDLAGTTTMGTSSDNLIVESQGNTIGGTTAAARNIISMASAIEIDVEYSGAIDDLIEGNYIGTDVTGTVDLAGASLGIWERYGAQGNTIGGTVAGAGNVIVGDGSAAAMFLTSTTLVAGNLIDSNPSGTAVLGSTEGIIIGTTEYDPIGSNDTIGGTVAAARNILTNTGIWLQTGAQDDLVEGNISGLDITGTVKLSDSSGIEVDGPNNTIGGTAAGSANVLAGISASGENAELLLSGPHATGNLVEGNLVGTDITGTISIRTYIGLLIGTGATNNTIGGTASGAGNVLSSSGYGLFIDGSSPGNLIEGNKVGTDITGMHSLYNDTGIVVASASNTIGGTLAGSGQPDIRQHRLWRRRHQYRLGSLAHRLRSGG